MIDKEKVKLLSNLIRNTEAKIILHSGWKYWFDCKMRPLRKEAENLSTLLEKEDLVIDDRTPDHATEEIKRTKKFSLIKASEIIAWLAEHKDVDKWIVINDLDLHNTEIEMHQIKTNQNIGLTMADVLKAQKKLL